MEKELLVTRGCGRFLGLTSMPIQDVTIVYWTQIIKRLFDTILVIPNEVIV